MPDFLDEAQRQELKAIQDFDNHWTEAQRKKIEANRPPWLISMALDGVSFSWWWRFKDAVMQRISNFIAGKS
jgi:hypothetical protein